MSPLHPQSISMRIPLRLACRSSPCSCLLSAAGCRCQPAAARRAFPLARPLSAALTRPAAPTSVSAALLSTVFSLRRPPPHTPRAPPSSSLLPTGALHTPRGGLTCLSR